MKILYVDDDAANRAVLGQMLATVGVGMAEAADAQAGFRMIAESKYDLIVMDLRMPGISGLTAIRQIRAREKGRRVPVVVISADMSAGARDMCQAAGADDYMQKPVSMERLFDVIGSIMVSGDDLLLC